MTYSRNIMFYCFKIIFWQTLVFLVSTLVHNQIHNVYLYILMEEFSILEHAWVKPQHIFKIP